MKTWKQIEILSLNIANEYLSRVDEDKYPIISIREKVVNQLYNDRLQEAFQSDDCLLLTNNNLLRESDLNLHPLLGNEFAIKLTRLDQPTEYIVVRMGEKEGKSCIEEFTVLSKYNEYDEEGEDYEDMHWLLTAFPTLKDGHVKFDIANAKSIVLGEQGYKVSSIELTETYMIAKKHFCRLVLALSYFSEKCINQTRMLVKANPRGNITCSSGNKVVDGSPRIIKIDDITVQYVNKGSTERTFTRHTASWGVRGHWRHYKSGRVAYIKPFIKGDRSIPVQNKVYQLV